MKKLALQLLLVTACVAATSMLKSGNNGSVSCNTFCRGRWAGKRFPSCIKGVTSKGDISCDQVRGLGDEVVCLCSDHVPPNSKPGNNGSVSCNTYCRGHWLGVRHSGCKGGFDEATDREVRCDESLGVTTASVTCECISDAPVVPQNSKPGNNGSVSCNTFCRGRWAGKRFPSCIKGVTSEGDISCDHVRGLGDEVVCLCSDHVPPNSKPGNNGSVSCSTYCRGNWLGVRHSGCKGGFDEATDREVRCDESLGVTTASVTCECISNAPIPVPEDKVLAAGRHNFDVLKVTGLMKCSGNGLIEITAKRIEIDGNGRFICGSPEKPFGGRMVITLTGDAAKNERAIEMVNGGILSLHGRPSTSWTILSATAAVGANRISLIEKPTGWQVRLSL